MRPENSYHSYDAVIFAELERRGFELSWSAPDGLTDSRALEQYDLIALNIKRKFTPKQVAALKAYVKGGGAVYGSWGGPMRCSDLLEFCGLRNARSVYINEIRALDTPITKGIGERRLAFPDWIGHVPLQKHGKAGRQGIEMVAFDVVDGMPAARDVEGRCLGALKENGSGRSAVLGFGPENYRFLTQDRKLADQLLDNLLAWLLPRAPAAPKWSNTVEVNLPRRADVLSVSVNGVPIENPALKANGSLRTLSMPVSALGANDTATVRVTYRPLSDARNVETWIHNCCGEMVKGFETPVEAANFLVSLGATTVQPLMRYSHGGTLYQPCLPGDRPRKEIAEYPGDFFGEYVHACHQRGIKVVAGLYLTWTREGKVINAEVPLLTEKDRTQAEKRVCPLDAGLQARNLEIVRHFLDKYPEIDSLILDDNFEFDRHPCYCDACKAKFHAYCEKEGLSVGDPTLAASEDKQTAEAWKAFWCGETQAFTAKVYAICEARQKPLGGWSNGSMESLRLAKVFDFLGAMIYTEAASMVRQPLRALPEDRSYITLLWGMDRRPQDMETEVVEAIRAGSTSVGFWIGFEKCDECDDNVWGLGTKARKPGKFQLTPGSLDAITRAFAGVEAEWLKYYRDSILGGDLRFAVVSGQVTRDALTLTIRNTGQRAVPRLQGSLDLSALRD